MVDERTFFDQSIRNIIKAFGNIEMGQEDCLLDWTESTECLLDYPYINQNDKLIALDLGKQKVHDPNTKAMQHINFSRNLDRAEGA